MKKGRDARVGFTVMELLMAVIAFAIMSTAVGSILVSTWINWVQNRTSISMQRDAGLATYLMAREIRRTPLSFGAYYINDGNPLTCVNTNGTYVFSLNGADLEMQVDGGPAFTLVNGTCTYFNTSISSGAVVVEFDLDTGSDSSRNVMTIYPRN